MSNTDFDVKMMTRADAISYCHARLMECGLTNWSVRLTTDMEERIDYLLTHEGP